MGRASDFINSGGALRTLRLAHDPTEPMRVLEEIAKRLADRHPGGVVETLPEDWIERSVHDHPLNLRRKVIRSLDEVTRLATETGLMPRYSVSVLRAWYLHLKDRVTQETLPASPQLWTALDRHAEAMQEINFGNPLEEPEAVRADRTLTTRAD